MNDVEEPTGNAGDRILLFPLLWTGVYGVVFGLLVVIAIQQHLAGAPVRLAAVIALVVIYVLTARGALSRWMAPADAVIVGSPLSLMLGGPGRQRWTPTNAAYTGIFVVAFSLALSQISPIVEGKDYGQWTWYLFGGFGVVCLLYGFIRQPRRAAQ